MKQFACCKQTPSFATPSVRVTQGVAGEADAQARRESRDIIVPPFRSAYAPLVQCPRGLISGRRQSHPLPKFWAKKNKKGRAMERRLLERNKVATTVYLSVPGGRFHRCRAKNLSAMGVFLEIKALGLPAGTVVNLVFAVNLGDTIRLHRRKAVLAHVSERGAGLMMQGRTQLRPSA
jgi:hypothetical protein